MTKHSFALALAGFLVTAMQILVQASASESRPFVHPLFTDHAVLQRNVRVPVWGWTEPNAQVTISFAGQEKKAIAEPDGSWRATLDPMPASSEARQLRITSSKSQSSIIRKNIVVGDVWICSGQSNMEMGMGMCKVSNEISRAEFPLIRLLMVPHKIAFKPESTLDSAWQPCNPTTLLQGGWGGFSAAGFFFGRELHRELNVPIGLIQSAWGGTVCEAWASREALKPFPDFKAGLDSVDQVVTSPGPDQLRSAMEKWYQTKDPGTTNAWYKPETDVSRWREVNLPASWSDCGLSKFEGIVWAQHTFEIPDSWIAKDLVLNLGTIADVDTAWINGVKVGNTDYFDQPRTYRVPAHVMKTGTKVLTLRIVNTGGGGMLGKPADLEIHPVGNEGEHLSLAGHWHIQETAPRASTGPALAGNPNIPTVLYNGMIAPLLPFAIKGAIWYQGEANAERPYQYRTLLPTLIKDWRSRFRVGEFGFHIVSLANYKPLCDVPRDNDWAELREAQAMTAKALPNSGIAMAIDIGEANDIHPKNKLEIGRRLALSALAITYGKKIEWSGPWYKSMEICEKGIRLSFDHAKRGLVAKGGKLTGFAVAGLDRKFVWADAVIEGDTVLVSSPEVPKPIAVRYGWDSNPTCNLYNAEGLPAVPFRTDIPDLLAPLPRAGVRLEGELGKSLRLSIQNRLNKVDYPHLVEPFKLRNETDGRWRCEFWGKIVRSAIQSWRGEPDDALLAHINKTVADLIATQTPDGCISSYPQNLQTKDWDIWGRKYVLIGLAQYYLEVEQREDVKNAMIRELDYFMSQVRPGILDIRECGKHEGMAASSILEAVMLTYNITGEKRFLDYAKWIAAQGASKSNNIFASVLQGVPPAKLGNGKAYEMMSCFEGLAELYRKTGDISQRESVLAFYRAVRDQEIFITGVGGLKDRWGEYWFNGKTKQTQLNVGALGETCVTTTWIKFCGHVLRLTGDSTVADEMERTLYNGVLGAMVPDGSWWMHRNPTPLAGPSWKLRAGDQIKGYGEDCCLAQGPMALALAPWMAVMQDARGPMINLYESAKASVRLADSTKVDLLIQGDYPRSGDVRVTVNSAKMKKFPIKLRIPAWSKTTAISVVGQNYAALPGTYLEIDREWNTGDVIQIKLDLRILVHEALDGCGRVALTYGPLVLAQDSRLGKVDAPIFTEKLNACTIERYHQKNIFIRFRLADGTELCDYASAGNEFSKTNQLCVWMLRAKDGNRTP